MGEKGYHDIGQQKGRINFVIAAFCLFALIVVGRLFYLQVIKHDYYVKIAASQHWAQDVIQAKRGKVYVKDETTGGLYPLAQNQTLSLVFASPVEINDKAEAARELAPIIEIEEAKIKELFEKNRTYVPLKHGLSKDTSDKVKDLKLAGIYLTVEQGRFYPEGSLASHLLGFVNKEGEGKYGIEQYFDEDLAGTPGLYKAEIDPTGTRIAFGNKVSTPAKDGADIVLTINRDIQSEVERQLKEAVDKFHAEGGSVIVMNPDNGEIMAMANYPTYDPNNYQEVEDYNLFTNSAVTSVFEPGSIFKVITMAMGLDSKKVEPDTKYEDTGSITLNGHKIMNSDKKANGWQTMTNVLELSLNTGTVYILNQIGETTFYDYLKKFGFGIITGIEQPIEGVGRIFSPEDVNDHAYATMTFGQSISTTPLQMATSFAVIANGGKLIRPHLVAEKIYPNGKREVTDSRPIKTVISEDAAAKLREMMVAVVKNGHGKQAGVKGYLVGGKTGTAQVPLKNGGGYDPNRNIGSFIGIGPASSPKFVVLAKIDSPKGVPWAESTAAPVVGKVFDFLFKYYQIPPTEAVK